MRKSSARGREGGDSLPRSFLRPWTAPAAAGAGRLPGQEGCQAASPPPHPVLGHCRRRPLRRAHPGGGAAAAEAERYGTGAAPPPCGDAGPGGGRLPARPPGAPVSRAPPPGGGPSPSAAASGGGGAGLVLPVEAGRLLRPIGPPSVRFPPSPADSQWEGGRSPLPAHTWGGRSRGQGCRRHCFPQGKGGQGPPPPPGGAGQERSVLAARRPRAAPCWRGPQHSGGGGRSGPGLLVRLAVSAAVSLDCRPERQRA